MQTWEPCELLRQIPSEYCDTVPLSHLNLARWFAGVTPAWQTFAQRFNVMIRGVDDSQPGPLEDGSDQYWLLQSQSVPDAAMIMTLDPRSARVVAEAVVVSTLELLPGDALRRERAERLVLQYVVLRCLQIWNQEFSGPDDLGLKLIAGPDRQVQADSASWHRLTMGLSLNERLAQITIRCNGPAVRYLSSLWERDVVARHRDQGRNGVVETAHLVVATLGVPAALQESYLRPGTIVDLEVPVGAQVLVESAAAPCGRGELCRIDSSFGVVVGATSESGLPAIEAGTVRLSVSLGSWPLSGAVERARLAEPGTICRTAVPIGSQVQLLVDGVATARAQLLVHGGHLAYQVLKN